MSKPQNTNNAMPVEPVTIRAAYEGVDDYLVERGTGFDEAKSLSMIRARINPPAAETGREEETETNRRPSSPVAVEPRRPRRLGLMLAAAVAVNTAAVGILLADKLGAPGAWSPVMIALIVFSGLAICALVVVVGAHTLDQVRLRSRRSHARAREASNSLRRPVQDTGSPRRSLMSAPNWRWAVQAFMFATASLAATKGTVWPLVALAGACVIGLGLVALATSVAVFAASGSRRADGLRALSILVSEDTTVVRKRRQGIGAAAEKEPQRPDTSP